MGSSTDNILNETLNVSNNMFTTATDVCTATCQQIQTGNVTVIDGLDNSSCENSGFTINSQTCTPTTECYMNNNLSSAVNTILEATGQQTASTQQSFFSFSFANITNSASVEENITNTVSQIMTTTCTADNQQLQANNVTIAENLTGVCSFGVNSQSGNPSTACTMSNLSKLQVFNCGQAGLDQSGKVTSSFASIFVAIAIALIVMGGILLLVILGVGGFATVEYMGSGSSTNSEEGDNTSQTIDKLIAAEALT